MRVLNELDRYHLAKDAIGPTKYADQADNLVSKMDQMTSKAP